MLHLDSIDSLQNASFVLIVALYPEAAKRVQVGIDSVVSGDRLPTLEDRKLLPFFDAFV